MLLEIIKYLSLCLLFLLPSCKTIYLDENPVVDFSVEELIQSAQNKKDKQGRKQGLWKWYRTKLDGSKRLDGLLIFKNDKKNGRCIRFYESGKIFTIRHYDMDVLDGHSIVYRPNGTIHYEETHVSGKLNGIKRWYDMTGTLNTDEEWKDNIRTGKVIHYYPSGNVLSESYQINGVENGTRVIYEDNEEKKIVREFEFIDGIKKVARFYKNGALEKTETY